MRANGLTRTMLSLEIFLMGWALILFLYAHLKFNVTRTKIKSFIYTVPLWSVHESSGGAWRQQWIRWKVLWPLHWLWTQIVRWASRQVAKLLGYQVKSVYVAASKFLHDAAFNMKHYPFYSLYRMTSNYNHENVTQSAI